MRKLKKWSCLLLAQLAGTGDWQEGQCFGSSAARSDVADWLTGLGFTVR